MVNDRPHVYSIEGRSIQRQMFGMCCNKVAGLVQSFVGLQQIYLTVYTVEHI